MEVGINCGLFDSEDFQLDEFVFEKMSGSAEDFYRHSMAKVAVRSGFNFYNLHFIYIVALIISLMVNFLSVLEDLNWLK